MCYIGCYNLLFECHNKGTTESEHVMGKVNDGDVAKEYYATISAISLPARKAAKITIPLQDGSTKALVAMTFDGLPYALHPAESAYGLTLISLGRSIIKDVSSETCVMIMKGCIHAGLPFANVKSFEDTTALHFADERRRIVDTISFFTNKRKIAPDYYYAMYMGITH